MTDEEKSSSTPDALVRAQVKTSVERMAAAMKPGIRALAQTLVDHLDDDGTAPIGRLGEVLFPLATSEEVEAQLGRLLTSIDAAAEKVDFPIRTSLINTKAKGRCVQFISFHPSLIEDAEGLRAIEPSALIVGQEGELLPEERVVAIFTFNEHEHAAINREFSGRRVPPTRTEGGVTIEDLGVHSGLTVIHFYSRQNNRQSQRSVADVLVNFKPVVVIGAGIAFGVDNDDQKLGDVLVSTYICDYEVSKVSASGRIVLRGSRPPASKALVDSLRLIDRRSSESHERAKWPKLHFGGLLSGEKLIDNTSFRDSLRDHASAGDIVGGEMEAAGLCAAVEGRGVEWIVIKAICDWGDGNKSQDKERRQRDAAFNSAWVVKRLVAEGMRHSVARPSSDSNRGSLGANPHSMRAHLDLFAGPASLITEGQGGTPTELEAGSGNDPRSEGPSVVAYDDILSWLDDIEGRPLYALLGEYGMGKTTTCQRVAKHLRERREAGADAPQPLYFDLRKVERLAASGQGFSGKVPTVTEAIEDCLRLGYIHEEGQVAGYRDVLAAIVEGALVIFDGLDEVLSRLTESQGLTFTSNLLRIFPEVEQFCKLKGLVPPQGRKRLRVLLSCRTQFFRNLAEQHNHLTGEHRGAYGAKQYRALVLSPFNDDQISRYLTAMFPGADVSSLMDRISEVHNLRELSGRPFTLKLVARFIPQLEQWRAEGKKVTGATLYREVAREWLIRDKEKQSFQPQDKERLAGDLAVHLWKNRLQGLSAPDLESWLSDWLAKQSPNADFQQKPREVLQEDLRNATFLKRKDSSYGASTFMFSHTSLQEFFLADALARALSDSASEARHVWALPPVSTETLEFLGQILDERVAGIDAPELLTFDRWKRPYQPFASERQVDYALYAMRNGHIAPSLAGMDLTGADLTGYVFTAAAGQSELLDFTNAMLNGARLRRAKFHLVNLTACSFREADLIQAELTACQANSIDWQGCVLTGALFRSNALGAFVHRRWEGVLLTTARWVNNKGGPSTSQSRLDDRELALRGTRSGHATTCRYSRDGRHLLSITDVGEASVWRSLDGTLLTSFPVGTKCCAAAIANNGRWVAIATNAGGLQLWDARSRTRLQDLLPHLGRQRQYPAHPGCNWLQRPEPRYKAILDCTFTRDDAYIVVVCTDQSIRRISIPGGEEDQLIRVDSPILDGCLMTGDERSLVACLDGTMKVWSLRTQKVEIEIRNVVGRFTRIEAARDAEVFTSASTDGRVQLWEVETADCTFAKVAFADHLADCAVSCDGRFVASIPPTGAIRLWDPLTGTAISSLVSARGGEGSCDFGRDNRIAAAASDGAVRIFDTLGGELLWLGGDAVSTERPLLVSAGAHILSTVEGDAVRVWNALSMDPIGTLTGHKDRIVALAIDHAGKVAVSASMDRTLRIWNLTSGECIRVLRNDVLTTDCRFLDGTSQLIGASPNGEISAWDLALPEGSEHDTSLHSVCSGVGTISPGGAWVGFRGRKAKTSSDEHPSKMMDERGDLSDMVSGAIVFRKTGERLELPNFPGEAMDDICFSNDERLVAVACGDVCVWDTLSRIRLWADEGRAATVTCLSFSSDNKFLIVGLKDQSILVRDATSGTLLATLSGHRASVTSCMASADGRWIVSASADRTIRFWEIASWTCKRVVLSTQRGAAEWSIDDAAIRYAAGDVWRHLEWRGTSGAGELDVAPLEDYVGVDEWTDEYARTVSH